LFVVAPWLLLVLLIIPPAALLFTVLVVLALPFVAAALAVGIVASPYLLVRGLRRRRTERSETMDSPELATPVVLPERWLTRPAAR
jgi:hypothetical protein